MNAERSLREEMAAAGRRLHGLRLVAATDGNLSARLPGGGWLVTPAGCCLGELRPADLLLVEVVALDATEASAGATAEQVREAAGRSDQGGRAATPAAAARPTSEWALHLAAYGERPDIGAVVHAHPPLATALTVAGLALDAPVLPEVVVLLGSIPTAPYATPSSPEGAAAIRPLIRRHDALLLDRHGAVTVGATLRQACLRMEKLEHCARIVAAAHRLGRVQRLTGEQVRRLEELRP